MRPPPSNTPPACHAGRRQHATAACLPVRIVALPAGLQAYPGPARGCPAHAHAQPMPCPPACLHAHSDAWPPSFRGASLGRQPPSPYGRISAAVQPGLMPMPRAPTTPYPPTLPAHLIICIKWVLLGAAFVQHHAQRPHVTLLVVRLVLAQLGRQDLWGHRWVGGQAWAEVWRRGRQGCDGERGG
eukprot:360291-Chlamydomonas_euryale.AAC.16